MKYNIGLTLVQWVWTLILPCWCFLSQRSYLSMQMNIFNPYSDVALRTTFLQRHDLISVSLQRVCDWVITSFLTVYLKWNRLIWSHRTLKFFRLYFTVKLAIFFVFFKIIWPRRQPERVIKRYIEWNFLHWSFIA